MKILTLLLALIFVSGCGIKDAIDSVPEMKGKLDNTNSQLGQMNNGVTASTAIAQLENYDNYDELSPVPAKLMLWGQMLAQVITADQLVQLTHLWINEIDNVTPPPDQDANGNDLPYTADQIKKIERTKLGRLYALMTVCGFLPESTVSDVIESQIIDYGTYETEAYDVLTLRSEFINDVLLTADLLNKPLESVKALQTAVNDADSVDRIARLPFVDRLEIKTIGFLKPSDQVDFKVDPQVAASNWGQIKASAERLSLNLDKVTGNEKADRQRLADMKRDYNQALVTVKARIARWSKK